MVDIQYFLTLYTILRPLRVTHGATATFANPIPRRSYATDIYSTISFI